MDETVLTVARHADEAPVKIVITFKFRRSADWVPHGESGSWVDTSFIEVLYVSYYVDGQVYQPTDDELDDWADKYQTAAEQKLLKGAA